MSKQFKLSEEEIEAYIAIPGDDGGLTDVESESLPCYNQRL